MRYNPDKVRKIILEIRQSFRLLNELKNISKEDFIVDFHKISSAKYNLLIIIEGMIDLSSHLISQNGYRTPEDYADTFRVLAEEGVFDQDFLPTLIKIARFGNRLVHIYWEVDPDELHFLITFQLRDIKKFLKQIGLAMELGEGTFHDLGV